MILEEPLHDTPVTSCKLIFAFEGKSPSLLLSTIKTEDFCMATATAMLVY